MVKFWFRVRITFMVLFGIIVKVRVRVRGRYMVGIGLRFGLG